MSFIVGWGLQPRDSASTPFFFPFLISSLGFFSSNGFPISLKWEPSNTHRKQIMDDLYWTPCKAEVLQTKLLGKSQITNQENTYQTKVNLRYPLFFLFICKTMGNEIFFGNYTPFISVIPSIGYFIGKFTKACIAECFPLKGIIFGAVCTQILNRSVGKNFVANLGWKINLKKNTTIVIK